VSRPDGAALMVSARDVWKSYGSLDVLRGVDVEVRHGEVVCLIGPSGSGKSTFLRCVNHLEKIDAGSLLIDSEPIGYTVHKDGLREARDRVTARKRAQIGMVFQSFNLFPHMTVLENIITAPMLVRSQSRPSAVNSANQLLSKVGLSDKASSYPRQLSGGQQQRVAIARALAMEPKLMLFDEPTSALDPELVGEVLEAILGLARDGMTMLIVTHEIGFAREVADRVIFMDQGRVVESGPPEQVIGNPSSARTRSFLEKIQ
jgi:polar amino acid transport system ATP-binding protein